MSPLFLHFCVYGVFGWIVEIVFTSVTSFMESGNLRLKGETYLWMFPIYGLGGVLFDVCYAEVHHLSPLIWVSAFLVGLYVIELVFGLLLLKITGGYVWKYEGSFQFAHLINFLYAPAWVLFILILEFIHYNLSYLETKCQ